MRLEFARSETPCRFRLGGSWPGRFTDLFRCAHVNNNQTTLWHRIAISDYYLVIVHNDFFAGIIGHFLAVFTAAS